MIIIRIGAAIFVFEVINIFSFVGTFVGTFAGIFKHLGQFFLGNPRITNAVTIRIGIRATIKFFCTSLIRAGIDVVINAITILIADNHNGFCIITETETDGNVRTSIAEFILVDLHLTRCCTFFGIRCWLKTKLFVVTECYTKINGENIAGIETGFNKRTYQKSMAIHIIDFAI